MATPKTLLDMLDLITMPVPFEPQLALAKPTAYMHYERVRTIFDDPNMIGAGIANKVTGGEFTDDLVLVFYVRQKIALGDLSPALTLPPVLAAPNGRAVFTDVVELGELVPQQAIPPPPNIQNSPIQSGFSVGHRSVTAGTVAAIVHKDGKRFILSNSHVLADSGLAAVGDCWRRPNIDPPCRSKNDPGRGAAFLSSSCG